MLVITGITAALLLVILFYFINKFFLGHINLLRSIGGGDYVIVYKLDKHIEFASEFAVDFSLCQPVSIPGLAFGTAQLAFFLFLVIFKYAGHDYLRAVLPEKVGEDSFGNALIDALINRCVKNYLDSFIFSTNSSSDILICFAA